MNRKKYHPIIDAIILYRKTLIYWLRDDNSPMAPRKSSRTYMKIAVTLATATCIHLLCWIGKLGLGTAHIEGFQLCHAKAPLWFPYLRWMPIFHNPVDLVKLYLLVKEGKWSCHWSRYASGVNVVNWPIWPCVISYFLPVKARSVNHRYACARYNCGFVCYRRKYIRNDSTLDEIKFIGYAFQIEMQLSYLLISASALNEVPIIFTDRNEVKAKCRLGFLKKHWVWFRDDHTKLV